MRRLLQTVWAELMFPQSCPPGHFYSPIPSRADIERDKQRIFESRVQALQGIDLSEEEQLLLLARLGRHARQLSFTDAPKNGHRYYFLNDYFALGDATILATMLLEHRPRRYVEIGSGFSSALVLDIRDGFSLTNLECSFIEPSPDRLRKLLRPADVEQVSILQMRVQEVPDSVFRNLNLNDVLFIDSSHVVKVGSDLNDVLFRVLPVLRPGVLVHFHDVCWPFEYGSENVLSGRSWNEAYFLRAFLSNNDAYEISLFGSWLQQCRPQEWRQSFPNAEKSTASSLWLRKVR